MKQYYGFKTQVNGIETLGLVPLTTDATMQFGVFQYIEDSLLLISTSTAQKLQAVQKMTEFGEGDTKAKNGRLLPLVERRLIDDNLTFELKDDDLNWFITNMVENNVLASKIIENTRAKYNELKSQAEQTATQSKDGSKDEQSISETQGSGLSGDSGE